MRLRLVRTRREVKKYFQNQKDFLLISVVKLLFFTAAGVRTIQENVKKQNRVRHIYYDYLV